MAQDITIMGASYSDVPAVTLPKTGGGTAQFTDVTDTTATASDVASGKQFFDALGVLTQGTASGGGGASNVVSGTFKGTTTGVALSVDLNYSGSGYPIAVLIYPSEGSNNRSGAFGQLIQQYTCGCYFAVKADTSSVPDYSGNTGLMNGAIIRKNSTSDSNKYTTYYINGNMVMYNTNSNNSSAGIVRIKDAKTLSVFISSGSHGFAANIDYTYHIIYSS